MCSYLINRVMLSLAETGWVGIAIAIGIAIATGCGLLGAGVRVRRGVGLVIPGKATVGEAVPPGGTIGAAVVPQPLLLSTLANVPSVSQSPPY
jgi:hypothetical protein